MEEWMEERIDGEGMGDQMGGRRDGKNDRWIEGRKDNMLESDLKLLVQSYFEMKEWVKE